MQPKYRPTPYPKIQLRRVVWRFEEVHDIPDGFSRDILHNPEEVYERYRFLFDGLTTERFVVFILNTNGAVQAVEIVTEGVLNQSLVHPREVYRAAVLGLGASIIVAHNHPSGNPAPSTEDQQITRQLAEAGKVLGIPLRDHIIFTQESFNSLASMGIV